MIKLGYVTYDDLGLEHKAIIGNGEELIAQARYNVDFLRDKRGKIVDVEYLENWQTPDHSFHVLVANEEVAIRYDYKSACDARPPLGTVEARPVFRQYV